MKDFLSDEVSIAINEFFNKFDNDENFLDYFPKN